MSRNEKNLRGLTWSDSAIYLADDDSEKAADRVIARIYDECQKLGDMPGMGHHRENLLDRQHKILERLVIPDRVPLAGNTDSGYRHCSRCPRP